MSLYSKKGIYKIENIENNKIYIGFASDNFGDRRDCHMAMLRHNYHYNKDLQNDFNTFGEDSFIFSIIEEITSDDIDYFCSREKFYIQLYRSNYDCYNITDGGVGAWGTRLSKEMIHKMSEINRKNMTGRKLSSDTKIAMSNTRRKNQTRMSGEFNSSILTENDVLDIKKALMDGKSCRELSEKYSVSVACISKINVGANWKSICPDGWIEYLNNR